MSHPPLQPPENDPGPPILTPPDHKYAEAPSRKDHTMYWVIGALFFLLLLAGGVIWLLPDHNNGQQTTAPDTGTRLEQKPVTPPSPLPPPQSESGEQEMEQALDQWLRTRIRAEAENADQWAAKEFQEAITGGYDGDRLRREQDYAEARDVYLESATALEQLLGDKENRLNSALQSGREALKQLHAKEAVQNFTIALAIAPDNEEAVRGAERAGHLEQVLALQEKAEQSIKENDLETARSLLLRALSIDPEFAPARATLNEVTERIEQIEFRQVTGQALLALEGHQFELARQKVKRADELRKNDPTVRDLQTMLAHTRLGHQLEALRQKAQDHAAAEQWAACAKVYETALALAPRASFAIQGLRNGKDRLSLDQKLEAIIAKPQRLQEQGPLEEARQILSGARAIGNPGPRLSGQISKIASLLKIASTVVDVILQSDGLTEVVIHRVGGFGKFTGKQITLRPGTYTVVGSRPGFRDVRLSVNVTPEQNPVFIIIRCEEPI